MIDRLIEFSVRRRGWILAGAVAWALLGAWAVLRTPIDAVPDLSESQVIVTRNGRGMVPKKWNGTSLRPSRSPCRDYRVCELSAARATWAERRFI